MSNVTVFFCVCNRIPPDFLDSSPMDGSTHNVGTPDRTFRFIDISPEPESGYCEGDESPLYFLLLFAVCPRMNPRAILGANNPLMVRDIFVFYAKSFNKIKNSCHCESRPNVVLESGTKQSNNVRKDCPAFGFRHGGVDETELRRPIQRDSSSHWDPVGVMTQLFLK